MPGVLVPAGAPLVSGLSSLDGPRTAGGSLKEIQDHGLAGRGEGSQGRGLAKRREPCSQQHARGMFVSPASSGRWGQSEAIVAETRGLLFFFPAQSWRELRLWSQMAGRESQLHHLLAG